MGGTRVKTVKRLDAAARHARSPGSRLAGSDSAQSVRKALLVLEEVAARQPVTVAAITRALRLPKTTVQRSLITLGEAGWLTQSNGDRSWSLSSKMAALGNRVVSEFTLREAAAEPMRRLRDATNESVLLVERLKGSAVVIDVAATGQIVQAVATIGTLLPLHASAGGKAMLAAGQGMRDQALRKPLTRFTDNTMVDLGKLADEIELIRKRGWARQTSEFEGGVNSVSAAIPRNDGKLPSAAVVLFGHASRLTDKVIERVAPLVIHAASEIATRVTAA